MVRSLSVESARSPSSRVRQMWVTYFKMLCLPRLLINPKLSLSSLSTKFNLTKGVSATIISRCLSRLPLHRPKTYIAKMGSSSSSSLTRYVKPSITCGMLLSKMAKQRTLSLVRAKIWVVRLLHNEFQNLRRLIKWSVQVVLKILQHLPVTIKYWIRVLAPNFMRHPSLVRNY